MPNRNSSDSSKGRGRPSRRSGGDRNYNERRSSSKPGSWKKKGDDEGSPNPGSDNRQSRPSRFKGKDDSSQNWRKSRTGDSGSAKPEFRSSREGGDKKFPPRRKKFSSDKPGSDKPEFKNRKNDRPNRFDSDKRERKGDRRDERPRRFDSGKTERRDSRKDDRPRKFDSSRREERGEKPSYPKFDKEHFRKKRGESHEQETKGTTDVPAATGKIRLNKYIANSGVCSRREADELIKIGLISVNGVTITELGYKVNPGDEVRHEGKLLRREKPVYILMNKPKGFLTTTSDPEERNTVMHLIGNFVKERVYPVGRLDRNTTGLLLLTNDGDLAEKLMHPSYNVKKIYKVELDRPITKGDAQKIMDGVRLEEGVAMVDDLAIVSEDRKTVGLEIHIGWNRVVRRIFEALEYEVVKLDRSVYAGLTKKDLGRGEWRFLKKEELVILKHLQ